MMQTMGPRWPWHSLSTVSEEGESVKATTENSSINPNPPSYDSMSQSDENSSINPNPPSYDSMSQSDDVLADPSLQECRRKKIHCGAALFLSAVAFSPLFLLSNQEASYSQLLPLCAPELVFAPDVADNSTTFSELAQSMLPVWYLKSVSEMPIFTSTVMPGDVYTTRKIVLKTRDLMDVFSPVYPNKTGSIDMWKSTRSQLDQGYMIVGEFQDLHNAHVRYSQQQLEDYRGRVLDWKHDFDEFQQTHDVPTFLAAPTLESFYHQESRLFWQTLPSRAKGADPATPCLQLLGSKQLERSLTYLRRVYPYTSVLNESAHQQYHNLRKEVRSLVDEFELFGSVMIPTTQETNSAIEMLKRARKLLGDINDDWTAYGIYVDNNEYYTEQERLAKIINDSWASFKLWVEESNFEGALECLAQSMNYTLPEVLSPFGQSTLNQFLKERKERPTQHFVIGNQAGDADSIISAISLAYIESMKGLTQKTPIVSIPKADLETQRPEVSLLLKLAGISASNLLFADDPLVDVYAANVTLVDHNVLAERFQRQHWKVLEIVDHHEDEGLYLDSCSVRNIAFADDKALVASACTLAAERLKELWRPPYPTSLAVLLLGVILLDSVDLSLEVGKVTQRDRDAVDNLLENTNWQDLTPKSRNALNITSPSRPSTTAFFNLLQDAKYDIRFWKSLSVGDALRLDYKDYFCEKGSVFGISTVLMSLQDFFSKSDVIEGILRYMAQVGVDFLGIMFAFEDDSHLRRQLALCGTFPLNDTVEFLLHYDQEDSLDLEEIDGGIIESHRDNPDLSLRFFNQQNVKPSRKQIGPILTGACC